MTSWETPVCVCYMNIVPKFPTVHVFFGKLVAGMLLEVNGNSSLLSINFKKQHSNIIKCSCLDVVFCGDLAYCRTSLLSVHAQSPMTVCNPTDCSPPGSSSMGFSRQEYWSGLPFPSPGDLPDPGIEPASPSSPALLADSLMLCPLESS